MATVKSLYGQLRSSAPPPVKQGVANTGMAFNAFERRLAELYEQLSEKSLNELVRASAAILEDQIRQEAEARVRSLHELAAGRRRECLGTRYRLVDGTADAIKDSLQTVLAQLVELIVKKDPNVVPDLSEAISTYLRLSGKSLGTGRMEMKVTQPQPNRDFDLLREFARTDLKGKERRIIELISDNAGEVPLDELAADPAIRWRRPYDNAYGKAQARIRAKLRAAKLPYYLSRLDNSARIRSLPKKAELGQDSAHPHAP